MAIVNQIPDIVNDAVKDALGKTDGATEIDTTDIVSMGKALSAAEAYERFYSSLVNRVAQTVYFIRTYKTQSRSVLRDEHEYGAFIQKVYYEMPEAVDDPAWAIPNSSGSYIQASPYDVSNVVEVSAKLYGVQGVWSIEVIRPIEQIKTAFTSPAAMNAFIDGIYIAIENSYKIEEERLTALAVNTSIAKTLKEGMARNLLAEYNTQHSATLTPATALENLEFLKYVSKELSLTIDNMQRMSTVYNIDGYETFTDRDRMVVEVLSHFAVASDMYLQADTFHNELVKLPRYEKVAYWQASGKTFSFDDCSTISITHSDINDGEAVDQSGIIAFVHDYENVAAYFGKRSSWELVNQRSDVVIHGEKARKGYAIDSHANSVVFYIAAESTPVTPPTPSTP